MRNIQSILATDTFQLECVFDDGVKKTADITPYLNAEAFKPLTDIHIFKQVKNNKNYVSWHNEEVDLSADTIWHIGI